MTSPTTARTTPASFERPSRMYYPIIAHVYHAHALRIHLLRGRIPTQIKSAYTIHGRMTCSPCRSTLCAAIATSSTETGMQIVKKVLNPSSSTTQAPRRRRHKRDRPAVPTTPHTPRPTSPRTESMPDHESHPSESTVPLHRTRETRRTTLPTPQPETIGKTYIRTDRSDPPLHCRCPPLTFAPRHGCRRRPVAN
jgi:hypothetical protein